MSEDLCFLMACGCALMGNVTFFYMRSRLQATGHVLSYPLWPTDVFATLRLYAGESKARDWSKWPLRLFWASLLGAVAFILLIIVSTWGRAH